MPTSPVYVIEYVLGACLAGYILNYILGRVSNGTLAQRWFDAAESFLVSFLPYVYLRNSLFSPMAGKRMLKLLTNEAIFVLQVE